jgi:hypothetical protein
LPANIGDWVGQRGYPHTRDEEGLDLCSDHFEKEELLMNSKPTFKHDRCVPLVSHMTYLHSGDLLGVVTAVLGSSAPARNTDQ